MIGKMTESGIPHLLATVGELEQAAIAVCALAANVERAAADELGKLNPNSTDYCRMKLIVRSLETIKENAAKLCSKNLFDGIMENLVLVNTHQ